MKSERCNELKLIKKIKKNIKYCIYLILLIVGLTFTTGSYYQGGMYYKLDDITLELGSTLSLDIKDYKNIITIDNILSLETNTPLDEDKHTTEPGEYTYYLVYKDYQRKLSILANNIKGKITVIDTIKPEIIIKENKKFAYGSKITANDIATCFDLSTCTLTLKEDIDTTKSGEIEVTVVAEDSSGNKNYTNTTITIKELPVISYNYYNINIENINNLNNQLNSTLSEEEKNNLRKEIVNFAKQFIGNPYVYGMTSLTNGTDCSGFTMSIYKNYGYTLPRVATSQGYIGKSVNYDELLPGDLIVYFYPDGGGHVGIYVQDGYMIHAATPEKGIIYGPIFAGYKVYRRIIY